jgi:hypothetical protein
VADQFARPGPIEPATALRGVHRFRDTKPKVPEIVRKWTVFSQSIAVSSHGSVSASGSATTCAAGKRYAVEILRRFF